MYSVPVLRGLCLFFLFFLAGTSVKFIACISPLIEGCTIVSINKETVIICRLGRGGVGDFDCVPIKLT